MIPSPATEEQRFIDRHHLMIKLSVDKIVVTINIKGSAYTRNVDLHSSYKKTYSAVMSSCFVAVMSDKCTNSCVCFLIISRVLFVFANQECNIFSDSCLTVTFFDLAVQYDSADNSVLDVSDYTPLKIPSMRSFLRTSTTEEDQELRLSGLAVFANACQPLADVSEAKIQINKIALINFANENECSLQDLLVHAQNAGYSVVIFIGFYCPSGFNTPETDLQDKLLIPVLCVNGRCQNKPPGPPDKIFCDPSAADRTKIEIEVKINQKSAILKQMEEYLRKLYYWFLLGPVITLEWLRRRKKLCCMSDDQQAQGDGVPQETAAETGLNSAADYENTQGNYNPETEHEQTGGETPPLLPPLNDPFATVRRRPRAISLGKLFGKLAVNSGYVILIVVALPVGISSGGWSFFRFDQNEIQQETFWDHLITSNSSFFDCYTFFYALFDIFDSLLPLLWSPLQIFCFLLYSRFACKTTWTVQTNFSKLIRSDWFASNMYLLILGVVVPYCSETSSSFKFPYYATCNMVCTICNLLFVISLNKHKYLTRYVFYISVCMICAYVESDIVAVFYFMLNSEGSLVNLKLTALRTVAITLTLTLSLSSSMHIIRKLTKPKESLFEGLSEK